MLRFYGSLSLRAIILLFNETDRVLTAVTVLAFLVAFFNREAGKAVTTAWEGFDPWWAVAPVAFLVVYGLMKANYERFTMLEDRLAQVVTERDQLRLQADSRDRIRAGLDGLGELLEQGDALQRALVTTGEELDAWTASLNRWEQEADERLRRDFSSADAASFRTASGFASAYTRVHNQRHNDLKCRLGFRLDALRRIIDRYAQAAHP